VLTLAIRLGKVKWRYPSNYAYIAPDRTCVLLGILRVLLSLPVNLNEYTRHDDLIDHINLRLRYNMEANDEFE
jgi:hypothetical protein